MRLPAPATALLALALLPPAARAQGDALPVDHDRLAVRIRAELAFATGLAPLHPDRQAEWGPLLERARAVAGDVGEGAPRPDDARRVAEAERLLAPVAAVAKTYVVHNVGHAHIDMNWMWSWPETVAVTVDTFTTVLRLMDEFPDFRFTQSQASVYEIVRRHAPDLFERIKARVAEGRWEVAASQWVEGDKNLASGEAIARHLLYTRRFMKEHLGLEPEDVAIDFEPDTFGHAATIPALLARGGVSRYYMCRGGKDEKPPVFLWSAPDGSRVLVNLETTWYLKATGPENATALLGFARKTGLREWMNVYGVGDHGGGPTRRDIRRVREMDGWPVFPRFRFSTTREYYAVLEREAARLPVLERELNFEFTGCYTSQSQIKRHNRLGEGRAQDAETAAALALRMVGRPYPADLLREAWTNVLFGQFHDILPGSGVRATREYQSGLFQQTAAVAGAVQTASLRAIATAVDTAFAQDRVAPAEAGEEKALGAGVGRGTGLGAASQAAHQADGPRPFVVFNPTAWPREELVRVSVWDPGRAPLPAASARRFVVHAPGGPSVPAEVVASGDYWGHRYVDVAFPASVGALGHAAYVVEEREAESLPSRSAAVRADAERLTLENERLAVRFDRTTGGVLSLVDKASGLDLASPGEPMALLEYVLERPRGMSAWAIGDTMSRLFPLEVHSLSVQSNPYAASVVARARVKQSEATVTYSLEAGEPWLEVAVEVDWLERGGPDVGTPQLRMRFPTRLEGARARYEIPYGTIVRDLAGGEEVPGQRFADVFGTVNGQSAGVLLLNDSRYGHSLDRSTLALTLLRSSYDPDPLPEIGSHAVRMALVPHGRSMTVADMVRLGAAFNHPLPVVAADVHAGRVASRAAAVRSATPASVVLCAVKRAEADGALILRLLEAEGRAVTARIDLDEAVLGRPTAAEEVDFLERPLAKATVRLAGTAVSVELPAHGIASVRLRFD